MRRGLPHECHTNPNRQAFVRLLAAMRELLELLASHRACRRSASPVTRVRQAWPHYEQRGQVTNESPRSRLAALVMRAAYVGATLSLIGKCAVCSPEPFPVKANCSGRKCSPDFQMASMMVASFRASATLEGNRPRRSSMRRVQALILH